MPFSIRLRLAPLLLGIAVALCPCALPACSELPEIPDSVCGNGVTEPGEDCDAYAHSPQQCRAPGQAGACRYGCNPIEGADGPACPSGWGCGADHVCRAPSGEFDGAPKAIPVEARRLVLGDFDGDHHQDVVAMGLSNNLGQSHFHALFLEPDGSLASSFGPDLLIATPAVSDLDSDGRDDLLVNAFAGIGLFGGKTDRTLWPVPYPLVTLPQGTSTRMLRIDGYRGHPLHQGVLALFSQSGYDVLASVENFSQPVAFLPFPVTRIAGDPVAARVSDSSPCEDVFLADAASSRIYGVTPCDAKGLWNSVPGTFVPKVSLPDGHVATKGVLVADMDADGLPDMVIGDETDRPWIAFGCGQGDFCERPPSTGSSPVGTALPLQRVIDDSCVEASIADPRFPLAVGVLDDDVFPDLVSPTEVFLSKGLSVDDAGARVELRGCPANQRFGGAWTIARVADVNRDGLLDVVAGASNSLDVQVLLGTGKERLNWATVPTTAPVSHLVIGDFDGDLVSDVAIGESHVDQNLPASERGDHLTIAFGQAFAAPAAPIDVGGFREIRQVTSALYGDNDAVDEIGVVSASDEGDSESITVLFGSQDRMPFAAYGLHVIQGSGSAAVEYVGTPWVVTTGRFTFSPPDDVLAFTTDSDCTTIVDCAPRLWVVPAEDDGLARPSPSAPLQADLVPFRITAPSSLSAIALQLAAGDLDGDGRDEGVLIAPRSDGASTGVWAAKVPADGVAWASGDPTTELSHTTLSMTLDTSPVLADIDGDGSVDLALIMVRADGRRVIAFAWNDGAGGLDLAHATQLSSPGGEPHAIACLHATATAGVELALLTASGVWLIRRGDDAPRELAVTPVAGVSDGVALAAGDVTGDGVDDLVVGTVETLRVFPGKAELP